ncbi:MAG: DoxX family protein [Pyrinomonadaceae bacterium]
MARVKRWTRYLFGGLFILAGVNHFVNPEFYLRIMPPYLPWHPALVLLSGIAEIILGALLLFRRYAAFAGWGLIALLIAVFPANLHMAMHPELYPTISPLALWLRLPLQGVLIAWAYWYTRAESHEIVLEVL